MKNKKHLVVFGIFALVIVTTVASFAFFTYSRVGTTTTTVTSGDIEFTYEEGEDASLANAFPVSDKVGAQDTSEEYTFTVNMKSSSTANKMNYNVYLLDANDQENVNYFTNEQIKFALVKNGTYVAGTSSKSGVKLSEINGFNTGSYEGEGLVLEDQEIAANTTDEYKLRIWISDDVNYSNTDKTDDGTNADNDAETSNGKYNSYKYSLKVKVTSGMTSSNKIRLTSSGRTITIDLEDSNGLGAYAITQNETPPEDTSDEWIEITNDTAKGNISKVADTIITTKSISKNVESYGKYYVHVKNKLNQVTTKSVTTSETVVNEPVVKTGMIPVIYDGTNWVKANPKVDDWYNYDDQKWANVVTVSNETRDTYMKLDYGEPISMDDINTMWVWVPRYEYETITSTTAIEIKINFLDGTESNKTENYITHPAFTFGDKSLTGIWVAKFEASSDQSCTASSSVGTDCDVTTLKINVKPNVTAWRGIRPSTADLNTRAMNDEKNIYGFLDSEIDSHMMKNIEWGAVAYLSQSKYGKYGNPNYEGANKEIYQNKSSSYITGMSNGTPSTSTTRTQVTYNVEGTGTGASTTGTIYGIYDMSGGSWEYMMGVIKDNSSNNPMSGESTSKNSGFTGKLYNSGKYTDYNGRNWPDEKYYDLYEFGTTYNNNDAYSRYKIGDATTETKEWYGDYASFIYSNHPWFMRGGRHASTEDGGIFCFHRDYGYAGAYYSFRPIIVEQ